MSSVEGLFNVLNALNREVGKVRNRRLAGLMAAGLLVQRRSQKKVPVQYGKLRASAYTRKETDSSVVVGYSAVYARRIHENLEQKWKGKPRKSGIGVYWGPEGEPKFLERAFRQSRSEIVQIVRSYTLVGR